jgi:geranylgeranyl transferase type-2 subunit beta
MATYLQELTLRLAGAIAQLPEQQRARHAEFLKKLQRDDGGFAGREGGSDLYYTSFGLRSLAVLGHLDEPTALRIAAFLRSRLAGRESIVDFLSLMYSAMLLQVVCDIDVFDQVPTDWKKTVAATLELLRREDGGYAKGAEGRASSTYHTFLVLLCLELIEQPVPNPAGIVRFMAQQRAEDGGFREISVSKRAGTNPTAAAIGALKILNQLDHSTREGAIDFLLDMQTDEGGMRANTRIPIADLLSTFTGVLTLQDLGAGHELDAAAALRYVQSLEQPSGGFLGAAWDEACDVEYSFYGLGCLALLTAEQS